MLCEAQPLVRVTPRWRPWSERRCHRSEVLKQLISVGYGSTRYSCGVKRVWTSGSRETTLGAGSAKAWTLWPGTTTQKVVVARSLKTRRGQAVPPQALTPCTRDQLRPPPYDGPAILMRQWSQPNVRIDPRRE